MILEPGDFILKVKSSPAEQTENEEDSDMSNFIRSD